MKVIAATGPVEAGEQHRLWVRRAVVLLGPADEWVSGAAFGIDTLFAEEALAYDPDAKHTLAVPVGKWHNEKLVEKFRQLNHNIIEVIGGYMPRNDVLAERCTDLAAFPESAEEQIRSGTWSTVRRARKRGRRVHYYPLTDAT